MGERKAKRKQWKEKKIVRNIVTYRARIVNVGAFVSMLWFEIGGPHSLHNRGKEYQ